MNNNTTNQSSNTATVSKIELPQDIRFSYACCGNCRYFDGDDWCGYHRTRTSGGDHCGCWED